MKSSMKPSEHLTVKKKGTWLNLHAAAMQLECRCFQWQQQSEAHHIHLRGQDSWDPRHHQGNSELLQGCSQVLLGGDSSSLEIKHKQTNATNTTNANTGFSWLNLGFQGFEVVERSRFWEWAMLLIFCSLFTRHPALLQCGVDRRRRWNQRA